LFPENLADKIRAVENLKGDKRRKNGEKSGEKEG